VPNPESLETAERTELALVVAEERALRIETRRHALGEDGVLRAVVEPGATFFTDPDGIRLEIVALRRGRILVRDRWAELTEFEDPMRKAGLA
jgi:hypothetical protein